MFQNASYTPKHVFYRAQFCYEDYKDIVRETPPCKICSLVIDESNPWSFFDGTSQDNPKKCGVGGYLVFNSSHCISFPLDLGVGPNNWVELSILASLLGISIEKRVGRSHVYGDSKLLVDWLDIMLLII